MKCEGWRVKRVKTHHFTLLELSDILFKNELSLRFDLRLLPNRMLSEELVCCRECRVMEHVRIALEHIANSWTRLGQTSFTLLLLLRLQIVDILATSNTITLASAPRKYRTVTDVKGERKIKNTPSATPPSSPPTNSKPYTTDP